LFLVWPEHNEICICTLTETCNVLYRYFGIKTVIHVYREYLKPVSEAQVNDIRTIDATLKTCYTIILFPCAGLFDLCHNIIKAFFAGTIWKIFIFHSFQCIIAITTGAILKKSYCFVYPVVHYAARTSSHDLITLFVYIPVFEFVQPYLIMTSYGICFINIFFDNHISCLFPKNRRKSIPIFNRIDIFRRI